VEHRTDLPSTLIEQRDGETDEERDQLTHDSIKDGEDEAVADTGLEDSPRSKSTTKTTRFRVLFVLFAALAVAAVSMTAYFTWPPDAAGPVANTLTVPASALNFGDVGVRNDFQWTIPVHNTSSEEIAVTAFQSSCACTSAEPEALVIPAGQTREVLLTLDLTTRSSEKAALPIRTFEVSLVPRTTPPVQRSPWIISGRILQPYYLTPTHLVFAGSERVVRGMPAPNKYLRVKSHQKLRQLSAECDEAIGSVRCVPGDEGSLEFRIDFTPNNTMPYGLFEGKIILTGIAMDGARFPGLSVPVAGRVVTDVECIPSTVEFGIQEVGTTVIETILLQSQSEALFEIVSDDAASDVIAIRRVSKEANAIRHEVEIRVQVNHAGHHQSVLNVRVRMPGGEIEQIPIPFNFYGHLASHGKGERR